MKKNGITAAELYRKYCAAAVLFTVCGMCGWIYETALTSYIWGRFADRGFLHVPVLPIYGVFAFLILPLFRKHNGWITVFLGGTVITTVLELVFSYVIEWTIGERLWSYNSWDFNFQGRISLYSSLIFGAMSIVLIKIAYPLVKKLNEKASDTFMYFLGTSVTVIIAADFIFSFFSSK
ncbi:MAG: putative ABC transporter permease [Clostridium sp.]|nr:putative ABC transporter permease [Clostridium sp.]MCM1547278.1 putative ABC transporter permease [Ruminococcus sp.]